MHFHKQPCIKISDISANVSPIYRISVMFDTMSAIDNRLREKSAKTSVISAIYCRYIGFGPIYHGNIESVAHARVSLIFR